MSLKCRSYCLGLSMLTHWGRATHICVGKLTIIGSDNDLSPGRRQAIIWTIAGILLIGSLGTNFSEFLIGIQRFLFKKMHLKMSSAKWRPFVSSMCWNHFTVYSQGSAVRPYYYWWYNSAMIPTGAMQFPIYGENAPMVYNYGAIGTRLSNSMVHSIDYVGE